MATVRELDGDEDLGRPIPSPYTPPNPGTEALLKRMAGSAQKPDDWESRCKRAAFELHIMRGTGVYDMPKLARLLDGK